MLQTAGLQAAEVLHLEASTSSCLFLFYNYMSVKKKKRIKNPYTLEVFNSMNLHRHLQASKTSCSFMTEGIGISGLSVQEFVGTHKFSLFWPQLEME